MRRPALSGEQRDITDTSLRRAAAALGYRGLRLPLKVAEVVTHPNRPGDFTLLCYDGERRRAAADRLRAWAYSPKVSKPK